MDSTCSIRFVSRIFIKWLVLLSTLLVPLAATTLACSREADPSSSTATRAAGGCVLASEDADWVQSALDGWNTISNDVLELESRPLPWIVLFDRSCAYHLAPEDQRLPPGAEQLSAGLSFGGQEVPVFSVEHEGGVLLPDGMQIPPTLAASASVYDDKTKPFFVLAMLSVWRGQPEVQGIADVAAFFRGVMAHEMVHTRQLIPIVERIDELKEQYDLPRRLDDDVIQTRFMDRPGYVEDYRRERELFQRSIESGDLQEKARLLSEALSSMRERRARYFTGPDEVYAEIEQLFLAMEGAAVWAHMRLAEALPETVHFESDGNSSWSQDQGLALYRLIDELVPDWQERSFGRVPEAPIDLLEQALAALGEQEIPDKPVGQISP